MSNNKKQFNNNRGKKPVFNYFTQNVQRSGEGFIDNMNAIQVKNACPRVFEDIIRGRIDIYRDGKYFYNNLLCKTLVDEAYRLSVEYNYNHMGNLLLIQSGYATDDVYKLAESNLRNRDRYSIIYYHLSYFMTTQDIGWIATMQAQLTKYRGNI